MPYSTLSMLINSGQQLLLIPQGDGLLLRIEQPMRPHDASLGTITQVQLAPLHVEMLQRYLNGTDDDLPPAA